MTTAGYSDPWLLDPNLIRALFLARNNARSILGFTSADGSICFIDYRGAEGQSGGDP